MGPQEDRSQESVGRAGAWISLGALLATALLLVLHIMSRCELLTDDPAARAFGLVFWILAISPGSAGGAGSISLILLGTATGAGLASFLTEPRARRRALHGLLLLASAGLILAVTGLARQTAPARLLYGLLVLGILAACLAAGLRALSRLFPAGSGPDPLERVALASGLGLAGLALGLLLLGLAGFATRASAAGLLLLMLLAGHRELVPALQAARRDAESGCERLPGLGWMALGLLLAAIVVLAPGAFLPPLDYDVLEYHIQLPREYIDLGGIRFLPHNTFSGFPQNMEMLTYLAFLLAGGHASTTLAAAHGVWIAKLLNLAFLPLLLAAVALSVRRLVGRDHAAGATCGLVAAVLALACQRSVSLPMVLYIELGMGAYTGLAVLALAGAWQDSVPRRWAMLAGLLAGAAAGCKYTGLVFAGAPAALCLLVLPTAASRLPERMRQAVLAGLACWLVLAPWLVHNGLATGNPFYPLGNRLFAVRGWSEDQATRFQQAHSPAYQGLGEETYALRTLAQEAYRLCVGGERDILGRRVRGEELGLLGLLFFPALACIRSREKRRQAALLGAWFLLCLLVWFYATHRLERFFHQGYLLGAVLSGLGLAALLEGHPTDPRPGRRAVVAGTAALLVAGLTIALYAGIAYVQPLSPPAATNAASPTVSDILLGTAPGEVLLERGYPPYTLRLAMDEEPDLRRGRVLLIGSADPFWLPASVVYAVVFARHPLWDRLADDASAEALLQGLSSQGITHIYVNWRELARLSSTYHRAYTLSASEQTLLRDLLRSCDYRPLWGPWPAGALQEGWVGQWARANPVLLPGGRPAGRYCLAPYELYRLPAAPAP